MKLYRLISNKETIVRQDGNYVRVVWAKSFEYGDRSGLAYCYNFDKDNLLPLTETETKEILEKLKNTPNYDY